MQSIKQGIRTYRRLNRRELATVIAALRFWQREAADDQPEWDIATDGGEVEPLDGDGIDKLCEDLNFD